MTRDDLIQAGTEGGEFCFFWKGTLTDPVGPSCLSQWYPSVFEVDGKKYVTAEHYMMAGKARLFGDTHIEREILDNTDPAQVRALGRKVRPFDEATWRAHRCEIVFDGNVAKFSQLDELRGYLLSTGDAILVEASPLDRIWGIGLGADSDQARDPRLWRGENLLGFVLMDVRSHLRG